MFSRCIPFQLSSLSKTNPSCNHKSPYRIGYGSNTWCEYRSRRIQRSLPNLRQRWSRPRVQVWNETTRTKTPVPMCSQIQIMAKFPTTKRYKKTTTSRHTTQLFGYISRLTVKRAGNLKLGRQYLLYYGDCFSVKRITRIFWLYGNLFHI